MSTNANPQAEYLRRLGHVEAANALEAATALGATPASGP